MEKCFVIQPFDDGKFDKRFKDTFEPAIIKAGFNAYRVDKDLSVTVPIEDIEKNIRDSEICFADLTEDNPNVWYELGYAFACNKDVVMVCSEERKGNFPFDIQHRNIIKYKTASKSDFQTLEDTITKKINALKQKSKTVEKLNTIPVVDTEGLVSHEVALLILIMENQFSSEDSIAVFNLKHEMSKSGFNDIATSIGIRTLSRKGMIETHMESDNWNNNQEYLACRLTEVGEDWMISNQNTFEFRKPETDKTNFLDASASDDLPF